MDRVQRKEMMSVGHTLSSESPSVLQIISVHDIHVYQYDTRN